eukprot:COSAG03_NODE_442_length_7877_cov_14.645024_5_plen_133_part_00
MPAARMRMVLAQLLALAPLLLTGRLAAGSACSAVTSTGFRAAWGGGASPCCGVQLGLFRDAAAATPSALVVTGNPLGRGNPPLAVEVAGLAPATAYILRWRGRDTNMVCVCKRVCVCVCVAPAPLALASIQN